MNKVLLRISVPKLNSRTTIAVEWTRTLWEVKKMLISDHKLTNLPREVVNYGFYYHALTENNTDGSAAASSGDGFTNGGAVDCGASVNNATTTGTQNDALHVFEQGRTLILLTDSYQLSDYTTCLKPDDATGIVDLVFRSRHRLRYPSHLTSEHKLQIAKENGKRGRQKFVEFLRSNSYKKLLKQLAIKGMDPNFEFQLSNDANDGRKWTPLVYAVVMQNEQMIKVLIENGALIDYRVDYSGPYSSNGINISNTAASHTSTWPTPLHVAAVENKLKSLQILMAYGASINVKDSSDLTALHHACRLGHTEIVRWLLINSVARSNVDKRRPLLELDDADGVERQQTALHYACAGGYYQICHMLLDYGANPNCQNGIGNTPLHTISAVPKAGPEFIQCVQILLSYGADKSIKNRAGQMSDQLAILVGNDAMADIIKRWNPQTDYDVADDSNNIGGLVLKSSSSFEILYERCMNAWVNIANKRSDSVVEQELLSMSQGLNSLHCVEENANDEEGDFCKHRPSKLSTGLTDVSSIIPDSPLNRSSGSFNSRSSLQKQKSVRPVNSPLLEEIGSTQNSEVFLNTSILSAQQSASNIIGKNDSLLAVEDCCKANVSLSAPKIPNIPSLLIHKQSVESGAKSELLKPRQFPPIV